MTAKFISIGWIVVVKCNDVKESIIGGIALLVLSIPTKVVVVILVCT